MNRYLGGFALTAIAFGYLATCVRAEVVVAEDFFYKEVTKDVANLAGFTLQSYGGGQNGSGGVWDDRWVAVGGVSIIGDDVTTPPLSDNQHAAVVTDFADAASLQRNYVPRSAAAGAGTIYFAGDFKVEDVTVPNIFAEFGILSPSATLNVPAVSLGVTDSDGTTTGTFFAKLGSTTVTADANANVNDALVSATSHRIVGKLELNVAGAVGDYNDNGLVDAADYTVWRDSLGTATVLPNRDPGSTGNVSQADYAAWKSAFGQSGADRLTVYFNPTGVEQTNATVLTVDAEVASSFSGGPLANIATLNANAAVVPETGRQHYIDNIAIGTSWNDVATVEVPRLTLEVTSATGEARLVNNSSQAIDLAYYEIVSASDSLSTTGWSSLDDQNVSAGTWLENNPTSGQLAESNFSGSTTIAAGGGALSIGSPFTIGGTLDLVARWGTKEGNSGLLNVANVVPIASAAASGSTVPEPSTVLLLAFGTTACCLTRTRRNRLTDSRRLRR